MAVIDFRTHSQQLCKENLFGTFTQNDTTPELTSREGRNKTRLGLNLCNWPSLLAHVCSFKSSLRKGRTMLYCPATRQFPFHCQVMLQAFQSGISIYFSIYMSYHFAHFSRSLHSLSKNVVDRSAQLVHIAQLVHLVLHLPWRHNSDLLLWRCTNTVCDFRFGLTGVSAGSGSSAAGASAALGLDGAGLGSLGSLGSRELLRPIATAASSSAEKLLSGNSTAISGSSKSSSQTERYWPGTNCANAETFTCWQIMTKTHWFIFTPWVTCSSLICFYIIFHINGPPRVARFPFLPSRSQGP